MKEEVWKPVKGYEGLYEVSDYGNVKSVNRTVSGKRYKSKILSKQARVDGYERVTLCHKSKCKPQTVHRLVAIAFIPNPENKRCVNHIDGIKENNCINNLEWTTHSENAKHAFSIGIRTISEKNHRVKLEASARKRRRPVIRSGGGEEDVWYRSITDASKINNVNGSDITQTCKGNKKGAGGFFWKYANKEEAK